MRVERLLAEHGLAGDAAEARQEFERRMETRRAQEIDGAESEPLRRGWCLAGFRHELLDRIAGQLGENHAVEPRRESEEAEAERIKWQRLGWTRADLEQRNRSAPEKLELAARLRRETTLTIREIAQRLHLGSWKSATARLQNLKRKEKQRGTMALL